MSQIIRLEVREAEARRFDDFEFSISAAALTTCPMAWIDVEKISDGCYKIVDSSLTDCYNPEVGARAWDDEVRAEEFDIEWGLPSRLWWNDVTMHMLDGLFYAPDECRLRAALQHLAFIGWDPLDI